MENVISPILNYLLKVGITTAIQLFILLGPGLFLGLVMFVISSALRNESLELMGVWFWVYFTAIGTVIHELGHAMFALLFGHTITEVQFFRPERETGTLGYVRHQYNRTNLYHRIGNFFIGIGPILLGSFVIYLSSKYLVGANVFSPIEAVSVSDSTFVSFGTFFGFLGQVFINAISVFKILFQADNWTKWQFYLFLYIVFAVGSNVELSPRDLDGAWDGFSCILGVLLAMNLLTLWIKDFATSYIILISQFYSFFYTIMVFAIVLNCALIIVFAFIVVLKRAAVR